MIHPNSRQHRLTALHAAETMQCRLDGNTCAFAGCHGAARFEASYEYRTRAGRVLQASRRLCELHARQFARRFQLPLSG